MKNTTLCYVERDDCWLMLHRVKKERDANRDKWIGLGGKCEEGESPEDCVLREVYEESGLTLLHPRYRGLVSFISDRWPTEYMHLFTAHRFSGAVNWACGEGTLEWVPKAQVPALPIWAGDKIFLRLLEEGAPFFSLKLVYRGERLEQAVLNGEALDLEEDSPWI